MKKSKKAARTQKFTAPPMPIKGAAVAPGKKKSAGHGMGGLFGVSMKKTEPDNTPPKQSKERSIRMARLSNKFI